MALDPQHPILALARSKGVLRTRDVDAAGQSRVTLAQLLREGQLAQLGRGLYALPDRPLSEYGALAEVATKSTLGVVEGTKLSDVAGQSLREIEQVSNELAALINSISTSTQVQTDMASEVASVMEDILKITVQTTEGTRLTANSIAQLTGLTSDLRGSVAGFKL